ncbi:MAG: NUDIX hydrolase [Caulobacterales bacterium]
MRERPTARVLLLDPDGRIALMKGRWPWDLAGPSFWFTVGGGLEAGETVLEAAAREIIEETGVTDARLGSIVWYREALMSDETGAPWLFKEHYVVAYTAGGALSREGWDALERASVDDLRWWTLDELRLADERVFPEGLAELLPDVLAGVFADEPLVIGVVED